MNNEVINIPKLFGSNVQKYRKLAGLTQDQLCEKLDISQKHLSIIETGTQFASAQLISRIGSELNVTPAALFGEDMNQSYMNNLYARLATFMENRMNQLRLQIVDDIEADVMKIKRF